MFILRLNINILRVAMCHLPLGDLDHNTDCLSLMFDDGSLTGRFLWISGGPALGSTCDRYVLSRYSGMMAYQTEFTMCSHLLEKHFSRCRLFTRAFPGTAGLSVSAAVHRCLEGEFHCVSQECVSQENICDYHSDCTDGSDEEFCGKSHSRSAALMSRYFHERPDQLDAGLSLCDGQADLLSCICSQTV